MPKNSRDILFQPSTQTRHRQLAFSGFVEFSIDSSREMIQVWGNAPGAQMAGAEARQAVTDPFSCFRVMHRAYWGTYCAPAAGVAQDPQGSVLDCLPARPPPPPPPWDLPAASWEQARLAGATWRAHLSKGGSWSSSPSVPLCLLPL